MKNLTPTDAARTASLSLNRSPYSKGAGRLAADLERTTVSKYAPKGWTTIVDHNDNIQIIDDRERVVATVTEDEDHNFGSEKVEANARLIAASPDLLEALKALLQEVATIDHAYALRMTENNPACKQARAALAKATGQNG